MSDSKTLPLKILLIATFVALVMSGINPYDRATWWLEVAPVLIAVPILIATYKRYPLTLLLYALLFLHGLILILGGHYTYARVPLGFWMQDVFDFSRNNYDRIGHFAQGFVPAILVREILIRSSPVGHSRWLFILVTSVCLAISAFYELIEWWVAVIAGGGAQQFLGTQGDVWDTQWDMFLALSGAIIAQLTLGRYHDKQIRELGSE
ncbi:MAG: DUF2238 domain-containing protein [Gammaproteobacteria bacterium]